MEGVLKHYATGKVIDIGCGEKPYQEMAAPYTDEHLGLDHQYSIHDKSHVDILGNACHIPFADGTFDTALCTDTLEHLEEPWQAIAEAFRVLKPGGYALYTVPFFWHLHEEPRDFYRFTKYGLRYLFEKNKFEVVEIRALSGFCVTFAQELVYFLRSFRKGGKLNPLWWLIPPICMVIQGAGYLLNKIDHSETFTVEYIAVFKKPVYGGT